MTDYDLSVQEALSILSDGKERTVEEICNRVGLNGGQLGWAMGPFIKAGFLARGRIYVSRANSYTYRKGPREWPKALGALE